LETKLKASTNSATDTSKLPILSLIGDAGNADDEG
jgi:hypothetical protein